MYGRSEREVIALRNWFQVTLALYSTKRLGAKLPKMPLGTMLLVHVWLQPGQLASFADLLRACQLDDKTKLSHASKQLTKRGFVKRVRIAGDGRAAGLQLLEPGRNAIDELLDALPPEHN